MRTEAKIALVIVVVVVIAAWLYFGTGDREPIELGQQQDEALPLAIEHEKPLDRVPGKPEAPTEKPVEVPPIAKIDLGTKGEKTTIKVDLAGPATAPATVTTKPVGDQAKLEDSGKTVRANVPAQVKIDLDDVIRHGPATQPHPRVHIIRSGDTLYGIAKKYYGRGELWRELRRANPKLHDPEKLIPGQKINVPPRRRVIARYEGLPTDDKASKYRFYRVRSGESFYSISVKQFGSATRWRELYKLNKSRVGSDPKDLKAGQTILLPRK